MRTLGRWISVACVAVLLLPALSAVAGAEEKMTAEEMAKKGEEMVAWMRTTRDSAEAALRKARSDKDIARMDAINEALIALKGVLKLAEDYLYDMQAALKSGDVKGVETAFQKIKIAAKKVEELDARIKSAGGPSEEGVVEGKPVIEKSLDVDLPTQDPTLGLEDEGIFVERPPVASPYN